MKQRVSDDSIAAALNRLVSNGTPVGWRSLREELRQEQGMAGRTDRLRAVCRAYRDAARRDAAEKERETLEQELARALKSLRVAEDERNRAMERAQLAELREIQHQDRWAMEIHSLRSQRERLEIEVLRLQQALRAAYAVRGGASSG